MAETLALKERSRAIPTETEPEFDYELNQDQAWNFESVLELMRRRRTSFLIALSVGLAAAQVYLSTRSTSYEATAKVTIEETPEVMNFGADFMPTAPTNLRVSPPLSQARAIVSSDRVLGRVVDLMPEPSETLPTGWWQRIWERIGVQNTVEIPPELRRHQRIEGLRRSLTLRASGGGTILEISAGAPEGAAAAWLANAVADAFVDYELDQRRQGSSRALAWLSQKASELRYRTRQRDAAMAGLVARLGTIPRDPDSERADAKSMLFAELQTARLEQLAIEEQIAELAPRVRVYRRGTANGGLLALAERYKSAKLELETSRLRYTGTHPEVLRLQQVVEDLARELGPVLTHADDPLGPERLTEFQNLGSQRRELRARVSVLEKALGELVDADVENAETVAEYERLNREAAIDREMLQVLLQRRNRTAVSAASETPPARILDYAVVSMTPVSPNVRKLRVLGLGMALMFGLAVGAAREFMDPGVYDENQVERILGIPLLGRVPAVRNGSAPERQAHEKSSGPTGESYRNLRTSILFAAGGSNPRSLLVTSALAGEGKTTTAINLTESFAQAGRKVLLVDADLRKPRVDEILGLSRGPGLAELLRGEVDADRVVRRVEKFEWDVITSGAIPTNPVELLGSAQFDRALSHLIGTYDVVVIDAPVLLSVSDALILAARAETVLLVHQLGRVPRRALERISSDLKRAGANALGFVFNQVDPKNRYRFPHYLSSPYVAVSPRREA